jgi:hypothetical protein
MRKMERFGLCWHFEVSTEATWWGFQDVLQMECRGKEETSEAGEEMEFWP